MCSRGETNRPQNPASTRTNTRSRHRTAHNTYVATGQGFIYVATVIDCFSKKVVGWSIADHMRTELVEDALRNAATTTVIEAAAIFHSDRGSVYTSDVEIPLSAPRAFTRSSTLRVETP